MLYVRLISSESAKAISCKYRFRGNKSYSWRKSLHLLSNYTLHRHYCFVQLVLVSHYFFYRPAGAAVGINDIIWIRIAESDTSDYI